MKTTEEDSGRCKRCEALEKAARTLLSAIKTGLSHDEDEAIAELAALLQEPTE